MVIVQEYLDKHGCSPFGRWFDDLDARAAAKVVSALYQLEQGNQSEVKGVGGGVFERRIHFGPGYRLYFGREADRLILLLAGGTKQRQDKDIAEAQARWQDYKHRKRETR